MGAPNLLLAPGGFNNLVTPLRLPKAFAQLRRYHLLTLAVFWKVCSILAYSRRQANLEVCTIGNPENKKHNCTVG